MDSTPCEITGRSLVGSLAVMLSDILSSDLVYINSSFPINIWLSHVPTSVFIARPHLVVPHRVVPGVVFYHFARPLGFEDVEERKEARALLLLPVVASHD